MNILFHPAVVHLPLGLAMLIPVLSLWLLWKHRDSWGLLLIPLLMLVAGAHLALFTGERIEDAYKQVHGTESRAAIHEHEEKAETLVVLAWAGLLLTAAGVWLPARLRQPARILATVVAFGIAGQAVNTGHAGGELVYGPDLQVPPPPAGMPFPASGGEDD
ncbi:MAG: hypothetical protein KDC10_13400 [Calditrichaeota bacterium]|nr:hypothetical protein [Calditrichota bacterium]